MYEKLFRRLIFVQTVSILSTTVAVIVDSSITSMFLGEAALSASGMAMPLVMFFATIGGAVAVGFQTVVARKLGQGDRDGASSGFNYILILTLTISIVGTACIVLFSKQLALLLGATQDTYEYSQVIGYLKGYAIGVPAYSLMLLLTPVMFIDADKNRVTTATFVMVVVDILLDLINVFYIKQEMFGMAVASSISYIAAAAVLLVHFRRKETNISLNLRIAKPVALGAIFKNSSTYTIYHICKSLLTYFINILLIRYGRPEEVAVFAALSALSLVLTSAGSAMGSVTLSLSSLFHGEKDVSREKQIRIIFARHSLAICGTATIIAVIFAPLISRLFIHPDSAQFNSCVTGLRLLALSLVMNSVNNCYRNYFQGVDKLSSSLMVCTLQYLLAPVGALFIILTMGADKWIWFFYIIGEGFTLIVAALLKGKDRGSDCLDREILIEDPGQLESATEMLEHTLSAGNSSKSKLQLASDVIKSVADICADTKCQKTELNLRAYEIGDELKCSVETNLTDSEGRIKQIVQTNQNKLIYSEVFGLKRIIVEDLRDGR